MFSKSEAPDRLVQAIRLVANGQVWVDEGVIQLLSNQYDQRSVSFLTGREQKVLLGIVGGLTNKNIAEEIGLSESSVKGIVQQLFYKAKVRRRSQLVRVALEGSLGTVRQLRKPGRTGEPDSDRPALASRREFHNWPPAK